MQVLRLQPGESITLFNGKASGEFNATVTQMGRSGADERQYPRPGSPKGQATKATLPGSNPIAVPLGS